MGTVILAHSHNYSFKAAPRNDCYNIFFAPSLFILVEQKTIREQKLKYLLPNLMPINIFNIHGVCCCLRMSSNINNKYFIKHFFCYAAQHIQEANMLIIWGFIPPKLARLLSNYYIYLPKKSFFYILILATKGLKITPLLILLLILMLNSLVTCSMKMQVKNIIKRGAPTFTSLKKLIDSRLGRLIVLDDLAITNDFLLKSHHFMCKLLLFF